MDRSTPAEAAFADALQGCPREAFVGFVADVWRARGWAVDRDGSHLTLVREGPPAEVRHVTVARDPAGADLEARRVDLVVTSRLGHPSPEPMGGPEILSATDLYEVLRYGLDRETADRLVADHLEVEFGAFVPGEGVPVAASGADRDEPPADVPPRSAGRTRTPATGSGSGPAIAAVALLVLVAAVAGGSTVDPLIGSGIPIVSTPGLDAPAATPGPTPEPIPSAATPTATPREAFRETADQTRFFGLEPTCERPPQLVIAIVLGALAANDPSTDAGVEAASRFSALPKTEDGFGFPPLLSQPDYALLFTHESASYGPTTPLSRSVVSIRVRLENATASQTFRFVLSNEESWDSLGCWRLSGVLLEDDGAVSLHD